MRTEKVPLPLDGMASPISNPNDGVGDLEKAMALPAQEDDIPNKTDVTGTTKVDDWNGDDDPANPHNWSMASRIYHTIVPALFSFVV